MITAMTATAVAATSSPPGAHRRWLLINAVVIPIVLNTVLGGGIAALGAHGQHLPLWPQSLITKTGLAVDALGTLFVLPFVTTVSVTLAVRRERQRGALSQLDAVDTWSPMIMRLHPQLLRRAALLGAFFLVVLGPLAIALLDVTANDGVGWMTFVWYKVAFCVSFGLVVTPLSALAAMAEPIAA